jgi:hypothetical protein
MTRSKRTFWGGVAACVIGAWTGEAAAAPVDNPGNGYFINTVFDLGGGGAKLHLYKFEGINATSALPFQGS